MTSTNMLSEWPSDFKDIGDLEDLLRCPICSEYMTTAMIITKCSHTYCSLCIRRSFTYKRQCPTCFVEATESELINNRILDDLIAKFSIVRLKLLELVKASVSGETTRTDETSTSCSPSILNDVHEGFPDQKTTPRLRKIASTPQQHNRSCLAKTPSRSSSHKPAAAQKSKTNHSLAATPQYGLRKTGPKGKYAESNSDASTTEGSDTTDSDVAFLGVSENISDDDFVPASPDLKPARKSTKRNKIRSPVGQVCSLPSPSSAGKTLSVNSAAPPETVNTSDSTNSVQPLGLQRVTSPKLLALPQASPQRTTTDNKEGSSSSIQAGPVASSSAGGSQGIIRVPCPVCGVEVPERHVNLHLDRCLANMDRPPARVASPRRKLMPKLVYILLNDKDLKKKCAELGLSTVGDRKTLERKHRELILLHNSRCDSNNSLSMADLVKEVERNERARNKMVFKTAGPAPAGKLSVQKGASAEQVEQAQKQYMKQHKSQFQKLIEEARQRRAQKQKNSVKTSQSESAETEPNLPKLLVTASTSNSEEGLVPDFCENSTVPVATPGPISGPFPDGDQPRISGTSHIIDPEPCLTDCQPGQDSSIPARNESSTGQDSSIPAGNESSVPPGKHSSTLAEDFSILSGEDSTVAPAEDQITLAGTDSNDQPVPSLDQRTVPQPSDASTTLSVTHHAPNFQTFYDDNADFSTGPTKTQASKKSSKKQKRVQKGTKKAALGADSLAEPNVVTGVATADENTDWLPLCLSTVPSVNISIPKTDVVELRVEDTHSTPVTSTEVIQSTTTASIDGASLTPIASHLSESWPENDPASPLSEEMFESQPRRSKRRQSKRKLNEAEQIVVTKRRKNVKNSKKDEVSEDQREAAAHEPDVSNVLEELSEK